MIRAGDEPIPGYRVEQMLGRGQYGEVWRATSPGRSSVALKFIDMTGRRGWKEFRAAQRVKQIRHAHLMPIVAIWLLDDEGRVLTDDALDSLPDGSAPASQTVTVEGDAPSRRTAQMVIATLLADESLKDRLNQCLADGFIGIPRAELLTYMQEAAKGIDYLNTVHHDWQGEQVGVQHCDIKPDNVMLMGGSAVICDFGVAQVLAATNKDTRATSLSGSPAYMAPEAFEAKPTATSDQYSLAVMYYELLTGELPLDAENFAAAYDSHRTGALDFSAANDAEQVVLQRATHPDAEKRFSSATEMVNALRLATAKPAQQTPKRRWLTASIAAGVIICVLAALSLLDGRFGTNSRKVQIRFDAPEAQVEVNGKTYVTDREGALVVEAELDLPLTIRATNNPGREDRQWSIKPAELTQRSSFEFRLPYTADRYALRAEELLASGALDRAAKEYAAAVEADPDRYARYPSPTIVETSGILWGDCLQAASSANWIAVGGKDGIPRQWRFGSQGIDSEPTVLHRGVNSPIVNLAVTSTLMAFASDLGQIWVVNSGQSKQLTSDDADQAALAFSGNHNWLVAAVTKNLETRILAWPVGGERSLSSLREIGVQPGEFPKTISCEGNAVVVATQDNEALIWKWDIDSGRHVELGRQQNEVLSLSRSADGSIIAYAGVANSEAADDQNEAAVVDVSAGLRCRLGSRQSDSILACAVADDGKRLATAERVNDFDETGTVWIWRPDMSGGVASSERILRFERSQGDVSALFFSQGNRWLAAGHEGGAVSIWRTSEADANPLWSFGTGDRVVALRVTPDQRWLVSGSRDGRIRVFDLLRLEMLWRAFQRTGVSPSGPEDAADKLTLLGPSEMRASHFPWGSGETAFRPVVRPNAGRVG